MATKKHSRYDLAIKPKLYAGVDTRGNIVEGQLLLAKARDRKGDTGRLQAWIITRATSRGGWLAVGSRTWVHNDSLKELN